MTKEELYAHPGWQWCTSEGAALHTLLIGLETTFREKLEWLEESETLSLQWQSHRLDQPPDCILKNDLAAMSTLG